MVVGTKGLRPEGLLNLRGWEKKRTEETEKEQWRQEVSQERVVSWRPRKENADSMQTMKWARDSAPGEP